MGEEYDGVSGENEYPKILENNEFKGLNDNDLS
jgi:hypothetical protein